MKIFTQISSIIVALLFVLTINLKSIITIHYFVNQSEIIELFCVNKDVPELACKGKCHLAKEFVKLENQSYPPFSEKHAGKNLELNGFLESENFNKKNFTSIISKSWITSSESIIHRSLSVLIPPPKV